MYKPLCCGYLMKFIGYDSKKKSYDFECRVCGTKKRLNPKKFKEAGGLG